ncbi:hypothetical protein IV203_007537 [Nitzschia inconspicua]|uniref:Uncharacterized protein n=1 Tax=Nitzschia inconspicua TaxID=303405 RepID=A0A9K3KFN8_9STRA|nr:hypothetical protein IV203_007537 [Nitzschia inconspicua]
MALLSPFMAFPSKSVLPQPMRILAFHGPAIAFHGISLKIGFAPTCEDIGLSWPYYRLSWHFPQNRFCPNLRGCRPFMALLSPFTALPSKSVLPQPARILAFFGPAIASSWHFPQNRFCPNLRGYWPFMALLSPFHGISLKIGFAQTCEDIGLIWPCYRLSCHFGCDDPFYFDGAHVPHSRFCPVPRWFCLNRRGCWPFQAIYPPFMRSRHRHHWLVSCLLPFFQWYLGPYPGNVPHARSTCPPA